MRSLRYFGITILGPLLCVSSACTTIVYQNPPDDTDGTTSNSETTAEPTPEETTDPDSSGGSSGGSTGTGDSATVGSSGGTGPDCNVGQACGNGCIEGTEECDCGGMACSPAGLGDMQCLGLTELLPNGETRFYTGGILDCSPASCQFSFQQCSFCGDDNLNGMELCELGDEGPSCQALGMGTSNSPLPCAPSCLEWDTTCCQMPLPKECE